MLRYLDTCLPDYFQGCSGHVLAVSVDSTTTRDELVGDLISEYWQLDHKTDTVESDIKPYILATLEESPFEESIESCCEVYPCDCESVYCYFEVT